MFQFPKTQSPLKVNEYLLNPVCLGMRFLQEIAHCHTEQSSKLGTYFKDVSLKERNESLFLAVMS